MRLLFCFLILLNPLQALIQQSLPDYFCGPRSGLELEIVYWRPSGIREVLALTGGELDGREFGAAYFPVSTFQIGYRVGGWYQFCNPRGYIGGWVTWQTSQHTEVKLPPPGGDMVGFGGAQNPVSEAQVDLKARYITADLEFGQQFAACDGLYLHLFAGPRYVDIDLTARFSYVPATANETFVFVKRNGRLHGVGPRIGLGGSRVFCGYWRAQCKLGAAMLFATRSVDGLNVVTNQADMDLTATNLNYTTWSLDGRIGLELSISLGLRAVVQLEGGWSAEYVGDSVLGSHEGGINVPTFDFRPFNIGGPYGRIAYTF